MVYVERYRGLTKEQGDTAIAPVLKAVESFRSPPIPASRLPEPARHRDWDGEENDDDEDREEGPSSSPTQRIIV